MTLCPRSKGKAKGVKVRMGCETSHQIKRATEEKSKDVATNAAFR